MVRLKADTTCTPAPEGMDGPPEGGHYVRSRARRRNSRAVKVRAAFGGMTAAARAFTARDDANTTCVVSGFSRTISYRARSSRNALATTMTDAPVSARTAIQSVAVPVTAMIRNAAFNVREMATFMRTFRSVARASRIE